MRNPSRPNKTVVATYLLTSIAAAIIGMVIFELFLPGEIGVLASQEGTLDLDTHIKNKVKLRFIYMWLKGRILCLL